MIVSNRTGLFFQEFYILLRKSSIGISWKNSLFRGSCSYHFFNEPAFGRHIKRRYVHSSVGVNTSVPVYCSIRRCFYVQLRLYGAQLRHFHSGRVSYCQMDDGWGDKVFYQKYKQSLWEKKMPRQKITPKMWVEGWRELRSEIKIWQEEVMEDLANDPIMVRPGDMDKFFEFDCPDSLDGWVVSSDSDHSQGFSTASFTFSANKNALFKGHLDTTVPKDGKVGRAGYCNIKSPVAMKSFWRSTAWDWTAYTHLTMRVRGDGRTYTILLSTEGYYDISWNDHYTYVLHTRGGPYWQDVKIPFSKFIFMHSGRIQDKQGRIPLDEIKSFSISMMDVTNGPFSLEIDYVGLLYDPSHQEKFAYEMYRIPKFWII